MRGVLRAIVECSPGPSKLSPETKVKSTRTDFLSLWPGVQFGWTSVQLGQAKEIQTSSS